MCARHDAARLRVASSSEECTCWSIPRQGGGWGNQLHIQGSPTFRNAWQTWELAQYSSRSGRRPLFRLATPSLSAFEESLEGFLRGCWWMHGVAAAFT
eukprot:1617269-Amphidinium_carterae.1